MKPLIRITDISNATHAILYLYSDLYKRFIYFFIDKTDGDRFPAFTYDWFKRHKFRDFKSALCAAALFDDREHSRQFRIDLYFKDGTCEIFDIRNPRRWAINDFGIRPRRRKD